MADGLGQLGGEPEPIGHARGPAGISDQPMTATKRRVDFNRAQTRGITREACAAARKRTTRRGRNLPAGGADQDLAHC